MIVKPQGLNIFSIPVDETTIFLYGKKE